MAEQCFDEGLENAFAVGAVGEDEDSVPVFAEDQREIAPAIVMPLLEKSFAISRGVEAPAKAIA